MAADKTLNDTDRTDDRELREILELDEAGVGDLIAVYEGIEERYFAAVAAASTNPSTVAYATHT